MNIHLGLEWIGAAEEEREFAKIRRPWVAEITGPSARFGLARDFLSPAVVDYSDSNSVGSRGVVCRYVLSPGLYEIREFLSWRKEDRYFALVLTDGTLQRISHAEAEARSRMLDEIHEVPGP